VTVRHFFAPWVYPEKILLSEQFNYGHREILLSTCSLAPDLLFLSSLQHGWMFDRSQTPVIKKRNLLNYPVMVWSERIANEMRKHGNKRVLVSGSPWAHLVRACGMDLSTLHQTLNTVEKVLFFPSHSAPGASVSHDNSIQKLAHEYGSENITVCLFWIDFINPEIRSYYAKFKVELTCLGFRGSSGFETPWAPTGGRVMFLPNLLELISGHTIVAVNDVSTPFWYAITLGKRVLVTSEEEKVRVWNRNTYVDEILSYNLVVKNVEGLPKFPIGEVIQPSFEIHQLALQEVGWHESESFWNDNLEANITKRVDIDPDLVQPIHQFISSQKSKG